MMRGRKGVKRRGRNDALTVTLSPYSSCSAPIYAMILEKENAIQDWRSLMGPTDATKAREIDPTR